MPLKHIEKSIADSSELDGKCKRNRYSLKKLLDRSRFSPRLLRLTRLTKSVDCDTEGDKLSQLVEEEYEESLTDFADLILEGLRTNTKPLLDPGVESSLCEPLPLFSTCQSAANASKLLTGLSPFSCGYITSSQITLPTDSHSMKQAPTYVEQFSSGGIYNEPCDAKPLANDVSLYPTDIYTATGCIHRTCEAFVDKCSAQTSKRNRFV
ncbi:hypothetical protein P879_08342 [Paragonimus westermani]|uniref:Uncharacterized protein n=1 Tax=Paragonimus westermani TaxID=34504 RepID=A0A8T0D6A4_9TREM|nr:hypothetical protein P879_08342 [Paragonimus westermani]